MSRARRHRTFTESGFVLSAVYFVLRTKYQVRSTYEQLIVPIIELARLQPVHFHDSMRPSIFSHSISCSRPILVRWPYVMRHVYLASTHVASVSILMKGFLTSIALSIS